MPSADSATAMLAALGAHHTREIAVSVTDLHAVIYGRVPSTRPSVPLSPGCAITKTTTFGSFVEYVCEVVGCGSIGPALRCDEHRDHERSELT